MIKKVWLLLLFAAVSVAGCRSDISYQNRAIDRARSYLLANCGDLSTEEMYFVRYNSPYLLHAPLLGGSSDRSKEKLHSELKQICVAWLIPGRKDLYMVFGVSNGRMSHWYPERMIIRSYNSPEFVVPAAAETARQYAAKNLFKSMDRSDINTVRFTFPALLRTEFELNYDVNGKLSGKEIAALKEKDLKNIQYSLVWKLSEKNLVFAGVAKPGFKNWSVSMADFMTDEELNKNVIRQVLSPAEALEKLPETERKER
ncbi:MAG: hypothetical protein IKC82_04995 [Lentisphaeria bacterium]|nr:hypothetical protein [Lentisphaeria bacterium]